MKMKQIPLFLLVALLLCCSVHSQITYAQERRQSKDLINSEPSDLFETFSREELLADLRSVQRIIRNTHPKLYADTERIAEINESIDEKIADGMTKLEFLRLITTLIAPLNCVHTGTIYDGDMASVKLFPVHVRIFDDKIYSVDKAMNTTIPVGCEILSINSRRSADIISTMKANMSSDGENDTIKYSGIQSYFAWLYLKCIEYSDRFTITYITPEGAAETVDFAGLTRSQLSQTDSQTPYVPYASAFEDDYALLTIRTFSAYDGYSIATVNEWIDEFFAEVKDRQIEHVILDVRGNGGGDPMITSHLFSYLEKTPQPYWDKSAPDYYPGLKQDIPFAENHYDGNLYVLMDGGCASSTGHILALLKYQNVGIFIGEESGGSFACTDSSTSAVLGNTKLIFRYSRTVWQVDTQGLTPGRGIMPDYEVKQSLNDYLNEMDVVLNFTVDLIENTMV